MSFLPPWCRLRHIKTRNERFPMLRSNVFRCLLCLVLAGAGAAALVVVNLPDESEPPSGRGAPPRFKPRNSQLTTNSLEALGNGLEPWPPTISLEEYSDLWKNARLRIYKMIDD